LGDWLSDTLCDVPLRFVGTPPSPVYLTSPTTTSTVSMVKGSSLSSHILCGASSSNEGSPCTTNHNSWQGSSNLLLFCAAHCGWHKRLIGRCQLLRLMVQDLPCAQCVAAPAVKHSACEPWLLLDANTLQPSCLTVHQLTQLPTCLQPTSHPADVHVPHCRTSLIDWLARHHLHSLIGPHN
jgi:hypothetical protein